MEEWILKKVEEEDNGARPIIRILQQYIEETVSDMVINEDPAIADSEETTLTAMLEDDKIILK